MLKLAGWLLTNLFKKPLTIEFKGKSLKAVRGIYRGYPTHRGERCAACRLCIYVCPSDAIRIEGSLFILNKCKCTACKDCADACPFGAMQFIPRLIGTAISKNEYMEITEIKLVKCENCGEPMPKPELLLGRLLGKPSKTIPPYLRLCPKCRRQFFKHT